MNSEKICARTEVAFLNTRQRFLAIVLGAMMTVLTMSAISETRAATAAITTTTLTLSASSVTAGTVVTLTAAVSNGSPVTTGEVFFCDAAAAHCEDSALLGIAQLTSAGTGIIRVVPGVGSHSYQATFLQTNSNKGSSSTQKALTVTGKLPTTTTLSSSGSIGSYTLTGTVTGTGSSSLSPAGTVSFLDTTNTNYVVGSATLGTATFAQNFETQALYDTGEKPEWVTVGDFNSDGFLDLAVANATSNNVSVLLGKGDGTFAAAVNYAVGNSPTSVVAADFLGNGILDLAVANSSDGTITVLVGKGDGTFPTANTYTLTDKPFSLATGDFNNDGIRDLAVTNSNDSSVSVLLGKGDGSFQTESSTNTFAVGSVPVFAAVGDFNHDGNIDLVVANFSSNTVSVLLGNGDGTLQAQVTYATGNAPYSVIGGDFAGKGNSDLAVVNNTDKTVSVLISNGNGTFQPQVTYPVGADPRRVEVTDLDGNGIADLVVTNHNDNTVSVLVGKGDGTFQKQVTYATGTGPYYASVGNFDANDTIDLVVVNAASNNVSIFLNTLTQTATATVSGISVPGGGSHQIEASYAGNTNFASSASSVSTLTASQIATSLALKASANSSTYGQSVQLTATLTPPGSASLTWSGEPVTFKSGSTSLGTGTLNATGDATLTLTELPAGTDSLTAVYGGDTNFVASTSTATSVVVAQAPLTITASNTTMTLGGNPPAVTPTYSAFANGDTSASLTTQPTCTTTVTSTTPVGTATGANTCTGAVDSNYAITYVAGNVTVNAVPDFTLGAASGSSTSATVSAGQSATYNLSLAAQGGFSGQVSLSCAAASGALPSGAACTVSPSQPSVGSAPGSATVTVTTTAASTMLPLFRHYPPAPRLAPGPKGLLLLMLMLTGFAWAFVRRNQHSDRGWKQQLVPLAAGMLLTLGLAACGGGGGGGGGTTPSNPGTPAGTYSLTVKGTSGSLSHTVALTLKVN